MAEFLVYLFAGLVLLFAGGEFLVRGGVSLASNFRISTLVVGVTVVSMGTSAPELVVSIDAAAEGFYDISVGNVVGSNIANIGLVLGLTILILPVLVDSREMLFNMLIMIGATVALIIVTMGDYSMEWWAGFLFMGALVVFVWHSVKKSRTRLRNGEGDVPERKYPLWLSVAIIVASSLVLVVGARLLVTGASGMARLLGVTERAISVSVIALGTSLPELVTSVVAAFRRQNDISIGNIVGSNIFNILGILGASSGLLAFTGQHGSQALVMSQEMYGKDLMICLGFAVFLLLLMLPMRRVVLGRIKGVSLVIGYIVYIFYVFSGL